MTNKKTTRLHTLIHLGFALLMCGLLFAVGWWSGETSAEFLDYQMREHLLRQAENIARTINPELVKKLTFSAADTDSPAFEQIRRQMINAGAAIPHLRSIYSMAVRGEKIVFGPDNLAMDDTDHAPPGVVYESPPAELKHSFNDDSRQCTVGPYSDEWGDFVSAFIPILDPQSGKPLMVVGIDIEAKQWQATLNAVRRKPVFIALSLILLVAVALAVLYRSKRRQQLRLGTLTFKTWIIGPTAFMILIAIMFYGVIEYQQIDNAFNRSIFLITEQVEAIF